MIPLQTSSDVHSNSQHDWQHKGLPHLNAGLNVS
jgi:hypothetical protein